MFVHFILIGVGFLISAAIAFAVWCWRKHKTLQDGVTTLGSVVRGAETDVSLLSKVHALENGGHLASGTAQGLLDQHVATQTSNGGQPAANLTPATT